MNIHFHIDHLVLHGFDGMNQKHIAQAIERELRHVLRQNGLPQTLQKPRAVSELNAGEFRMKQGERPNRIGQQVVHRIYQGLAQ